MNLKRTDFLKGLARGGTAVGLLGICSVLASREATFKCTQVCGSCAKNAEGNCSLKTVESPQPLEVVSVEESFVCTERCGRCEKNVDGKCLVGKR